MSLDDRVPVSHLLNGETVSLPPSNHAEKMLAEAESKRAELARLEAEDDRQIRAALGDDCPPLQRKLFEAFIREETDPDEEEGLSEDQVLEVVYGSDARDNPNRYRDRLRALQSALNDRLLKHMATPF